MRKLLLSIFMMVAVVATGFGQAEVTLTMSDLDLPSSNTSPITKTVDGFTITAATTSGTKPVYNTTAKDLRVYAGGTLKLESTVGSMTKVVINVSTNGLKRWSKENTVNVGTLTNDVDAKTITWEGDAESFTITVGANATLGTDGASKAGQLCLSSVDITYTGAPSTKPATPTFTPAPGDYTSDVDVTIACATAGASIYYTTDGTDPTSASIAYAPFTVSTTTTVKAIAIKDGESSSIATATYEFPISVASIADFLAFTSENSDELIKFTCPLTVSYRAISSSNTSTVYMFVQDGTDALQIYATGAATFGADYVNGSVIPAGAVGTVGFYNSAIQLKPMTSTFGTATTGTAITPAALTVAEAKVATSAMQSELVKLSGVTLSGNNLVSGSDQVAIYNRFAGVTVPTDTKTYDVIGIVNMNNTTPQIFPISFTEVVGDVASPVFSVAGGDYTSTQTVAITCTDADAKIYYTINGDVPTSASTEYTEPISISTTTTLKAIAIKDGKESTITSAIYEFPISVSTVADFIALSDGTLATISIPLSVVYQNGSRLFVTDGTDGLLIYGNLGKTYFNGQSIPAGATGERTTYNGVIEMISMIASTFGDGVESEEVAPTSMELSAVTVADQNKYVVFSKVKYTANGTAGTLTAGTEELATYNQFAITIPENLAVEYDVAGILTVRNNAPQLYLLSFEVSTGIQGTEATAATIIGGYSQIEINATENAEVLIVNTLGQAVASKTISAGATTVGVAPGLYIVKVNNTVSKVVVK